VTAESSRRASRARAASPRARAGLLALALGAAACGSSTYSVDNKCPNKIAGPIGDPTGGRWTVQSYCQIPYARTAADDWCSKLVLDNSGVRDGLFLGTEITNIQPGSWIDYDAAPVGLPCGPQGSLCGTYEEALIFAGRTSTIFPMACMRQHEANPTCLDLQAKIRELHNVLPTIQDVTCTDATSGDACSCSYTVTTATVATNLGAWRVEGGLLVHYPGTLAQAGFVDFAINGDRMDMHGHNGMPLLGHDPLRNLTLTHGDRPKN
jgi:hypothetical protein